MPVFEAGQMYEIHINDSLLTLVPNTQQGDGYQRLPDALQLHYHGPKKHLLSIVDTLEKTNHPRQIILVADDVEKLFRHFSSLFRRIEAAGGVVRNKKGRVLTIFRRKIWDLPKGKLDPGETFKEAAIREVLEETGLKSVKLTGFLMGTYHMFRTRKRGRALKYVEWYSMKTKHMDLKWQVEEDIEDARWVKPKSLLNGEYKVFSNIRDVVKCYVRKVEDGD